MKRIICLTLTVAMLMSVMTACAAGSGAPISIQEPGELQIGDTVQLQAVNARGKTIKADQLFWSSADSSVAKVTEDGMLTVVGEGFCTVTAKDRNDLSRQASVDVFCAYTVSPALQTVKTRADDSLNSSGAVDSLVKSATKLGKTVVQACSGKIGNLGIASLFLSLFQKDKYVITLSECRYTFTDGVVYTVADWGNEAVVIDPTLITGDSVYACLDYAVDTDHGHGSTLDDLAAAVRSEIAARLPADGTYRLDLMDDRYEYRVVVVADYTTFRMEDNYSNGAIVAVGLTIQDIWEWELSDFDDVNNNFMYKITTNDVVNVQNIRLRVECREKQ